jgi:hypothetical protein
MIGKAKQEGFIYREHQALLSSTDEPRSLLDALLKHEPPAGLERWLTRDD